MKLISIPYTKHTLILTAIIVLIPLALAGQQVNVAVAANLRYAMDDIREAYTRLHPGVRLEVSLGSSGMLTQQILQGAPFDIFLAADNQYPVQLQKRGFTSGEVKIYALGKLALWSRSVDVANGSGILTRREVSRIAIANPKVAPYGKIAVEYLKNKHLYDQVKDKLVFADNIAQAAQYAQTGNADVAIIAFSLVFGGEMQKNGHYFVLEPGSYQPVKQACTLIKGWEKNPESKRFLQFILGSACKPIFEKYGYQVP